MTTAKEVMKMIKDNDVKYVDFRFTDPRGKWQHVTFDVTMIEEDTFAEGQMFDGSSIAGWKAINESDMNLMPDPATACIDPFFAETTLCRWSATCSSRPPASLITATRAASPRKPKAWSRPSGVGDTIFFGPEAEFFVFDDVKYAAEPYNTGFRLELDRTADQFTAPNTKAAISATASAPRKVTSRCRRKTLRRTCAARCWRPWPRWA